MVYRCVVVGERHARSGRHALMKAWPVSNALKLYVPSGQWLVKSLTLFCQEQCVGNAEITGIGSITNIWVLLNPNGTMKVQNFKAGPSYEMTSLIGNVAIRKGLPLFDASGLASGAYPQIDTSVQTLNCFAHVHVTFANPDMSISGGHLLDAQVSIGAALIVRPMSGKDCAPGLTNAQVPSGCVTDVDIPVPPYGVFSNWDHRYWFPSK